MFCSTINPPPPPLRHTVCIYCTFSLVRGEGVGGQREDIGATVHKYSSFIHDPWGQQFTSWVENTNEWMYLQSMKSVKHNAANSVNRSILKKSRHIGFGVFIVHSSMVKHEVRSPKFIWVPVYMYSLAETLQIPPPPRIWAHIRGRYWSAR